MRYLKSITTLSVFLLLGCSDDKKTTTDVSKAQAGGGNPPVEQNPETKPSAKELENSPAKPTTLADWIKDKRIYFTIPFIERILWIEFTKEGAMKGTNGENGPTYTVENLKVTALESNSSSGRSIGSPNALAFAFVFPSTFVSKGDKIHTQSKSGEPRPTLTVVRVENISETPKSFIEYEPNTSPTSQLGQGAIAKALENKRLHFGVHGFETNCVQFFSNGMVMTRGDDEPLVAETTIGQIIKLKELWSDSMEYAFRFSKPAIQAGDKFMVFRGKNLLDPYETYPVLVFKLEDLPSGGMADLISGKRIHYEPAEKASWIQFDVDGTAIDEYGYFKYLFWVNGLKASIPKQQTEKPSVSVTFHAQTLKAGDSITITRGNKIHATKITMVKPASMPVGLTGEEKEEEKKRRAQAPVIASTGNIREMTRAMHRNAQKNTIPEQWCDFFISKKVPLETFLSPQLPQTPKLKAALKQGGGKLVNPSLVSHYAINKAMINRDWDLLHEQVLIFECDLGWNGAGGMADALKYMETYKLKWIAVGYGDGSTRLVTKEELTNLPWATPVGN